MYFIIATRKEAKAVGLGRNRIIPPSDKFPHAATDGLGAVLVVNVGSINGEMSKCFLGVSMKTQRGLTKEENAV